ncbi:MAG: porin [Hyphomicrobiales bacterium]|nr:porin [Hyphomicrobiales bacterium]
MKMRHVLLASAAALSVVSSARAADLPTRKAAPVNYVKVCDAYGDRFFYIPGTDTCLRIGGAVLAATAISNTPTSVWAGYTPSAMGLGSALPVAPVLGDLRDATSMLAVGRIEADARTMTQWGTLRTFVRVDSVFGSGQVFATGGFPLPQAGMAPLWGGTPFAARDTTTLDKGFIQFAGLTMGRIQSMFDFYADSVGFTLLRGSNQTVDALSYTAAFGGGLSATLSAEDSVSHRGPIGSVVMFPNGVPTAQLNGTRIPDIVANLRIDQAWGAAQLSGAMHQVRGGLYSAGLTGVPPGIAEIANTNGMGFALQGGVKFKLDMLSPGDVLWLQATYANGAIGYVTGDNLAYVNGVGTSTNYGVGVARVSSGNGWNLAVDSDCVFTYSGGCSKSSAFAFTGALRHFWTPTLSSTLSGSYYQVRYGDNAVNPIPGAMAWNSPGYRVGQTNYKEITAATGLIWSPVKSFEIGAEFEYQHGITSRPIGLAPDAALIAAGMPAYKGQADLFRGSLRMVRSF